MEAATRAGWTSCPKCSRRARAGQPYCEMCGDKLLVGREAAPPRRSLHCEQCGASILIPAGERTASCAFCGTPYVAAGEAEPGRFAPEFVLPFSVAAREAQAAFKAWLGKSGWLSPGDLSLRGGAAALRGVYIPFWSFSMRSKSEWSARIGEHWYETITETYTTTEKGKTVTRTRTRQVRHTEWYPLAGRFHQFHSHYLVSASRGLPQAVADRILPFPVGEVNRYESHYLSGWLCEEYSIEREEAARVSEAHFRVEERAGIEAFLPGDCQADLAVSTGFHAVTEDLVLLPIWIFAYTYGGRTFRYVLNGATGKAHGEKPISGARVALLVLAILILAALAVLGALALSGG